MAADPSHALSAGRLTPEAAGGYVGELFEEHSRMVYGVCRLLLRDSVEAEDATQQAFLSAYRSLLGGRLPREPAPWLAAIARNECRARIRTRMREHLVVVTDEDATSPDLEEVAGSRAEIRALCEALTELPQHQRDAVVLREFYGLSYDEVGAALGVSSAAVDSLLVRARRRLEQELGPARKASAALLVPAALRDSLAQALPGFGSSSATVGLLTKAASVPLAAKLSGAALTLALTGTIVVGTVPRGAHPRLAERALRAIRAESAQASPGSGTAPVQARLEDASEAVAAAEVVEPAGSSGGGDEHASALHEAPAPGGDDSSEPSGDSSGEGPSGSGNQDGRETHEGGDSEGHHDSGNGSGAAGADDEASDDEGQGGGSSVPGHEGEGSGDAEQDGEGSGSSEGDGGTGGDTVDPQIDPEDSSGSSGSSVDEEPADGPSSDDPGGS